MPIYREIGAYLPIRFSQTTLVSRAHQSIRAIARDERWARYRLPMIRRCGLALALFAAAGLASSLSRADTTTTPYPGVTHRVHEGDGQRFHLVTIDLTQPAVRLRVSGEENRGHTLAQIAKAEGAVLAVNGQIFRPDFSLCGIAMSRGISWAKADDTSCRYSLGWGGDAQSWTSFIGEGIGEGLGKGPFPAGITDVIGGYPWLVKGGVLCDGSHPDVCTIPSGASARFRGPNPRTFLGVDEKRTRAFLVVVDGRENGAAAGMTLIEGAQLMATTIGAFEAVNLDGGGSSELWIANEGGVVNVPSDGSERVVADAIVLQLATPAAASPVGAAPLPAPRPPARSCGCRVGTHDSRGAEAGALVMITFALARRRRRS